MIRQKKSKLQGNVYAIETKKGFGFFQCVSIDSDGIDVVRVLDKILPSIDQFKNNMVLDKERYYTKIVVGAADKSKLISFVGNYPLPDYAKAPKQYRDLDIYPDNVRYWYIVNDRTLSRKYVTKITDSFLSLSPHGIMNAAFLRERLEENWSLSEWK